MWGKGFQVRGSQESRSGGWRVVRLDHQSTVETVDKRGVDLFQTVPEMWSFDQRECVSVVCITVSIVIYIFF